MNPENTSPTIHECILHYHLVTIISSEILRRSTHWRLFKFEEIILVWYVCVWIMLGISLQWNVAMKLYLTWYRHTSFHVAKCSTFKVIDKISHGYTPITQLKTFNEYDQPSTDPDSLNLIEIGHLDAEDGAYRLAATVQFSKIHAPLT